MNLTTGVWTVPSSGRYHVTVTINYSTPTLTAVIAGTTDPHFAVRRSGINLLAGRIPILAVNIASPSAVSLRAILGSGFVTFVGDLQLVAGDQLSVQYVADGLGLTLTLGTTDVVPGIVWSVHRV